MREIIFYHNNTIHTADTISLDEIRALKAVKSTLAIIARGLDSKQSPSDADLDMADSLRGMADTLTAVIYGGADIPPVAYGEKPAP